MSVQAHPANDAYVFEIGMLFCTEPNCVLHVRPGDPGVDGAGNWATVNGVTVGRRLVAGRMICDFCAAGASIPPPG